MAMKDLQELFVNELKDTYDAEHRITAALPKMVKEASSLKLKSALEHHLKQTQQHIARLELVFEEAGEKPARKTCQAMVGLIGEAESLMGEGGPESVRDAAIIAAGQKIEHYEMATYGCLRDWAQLLDYDESARELQQTLDEEGQSDKRFTEMSKKLNLEAVDGLDEEAELVGAGARRTTAGAPANSRRSGAIANSGGSSGTGHRAASGSVGKSGRPAPRPAARSSRSR